MDIPHCFFYLYLNTKNAAITRARIPMKKRTTGSQLRQPAWGCRNSCLMSAAITSGFDAASDGGV